ncbi:MULTISPECIES: DsbA family oxidoreductase [unclassified Agarivorans]|uniref:DsbA family oxidoreductase n=1 Tax=unclassified Agarivorans TaxID=2636026 RepID=UPI0026E35373|nr:MULTISPECIES: DsbA family oxidoreductase [unclassified Agarivorans]MDO6684163.1 DsbA family oxidoreductase [Agarivorans sp. 3_MG-2023]MDO6714103.1 DsbA family oxidoreductase [Agarivorans sp. 2_MG-2023]
MAAGISLRIDIVSDVVCPWCIVGYLRLQEALSQLDDNIRPHIQWHPFELNPKMPAEGQNLREHIQEKYGSTTEQSEAVREQLKGIGNELGFSFNFNQDSRIYNTFEAHQLLHWSEPYGKQTEFKLALFEAYFSQGKDPSDRDTLLAIVEQVGLSSELAQRVLKDQLYVEEVRNSQQTWQNHGIQAVPAFIINNRYLLSGAQPSENLLDAINESLSKG